jgi:hypothetical protein
VRRAPPKARAPKRSAEVPHRKFAGEPLAYRPRPQPKSRALIDEIARECGEADDAVIDNERFESTHLPR